MRQGRRQVGSHCRGPQRPLHAAPPGGSCLPKSPSPRAGQEGDLVSVAVGRHAKQARLLRSTEVLVEAGFRGLTDVFQDEPLGGGSGGNRGQGGGPPHRAPARGPSRAEGAVPELKAAVAGHAPREAWGQGSRARARLPPAWSPMKSQAASRGPGCTHLPAQPHAGRAACCTGCGRCWILWAPRGEGHGP